MNRPIDQPPSQSGLIWLYGKGTKVEVTVGLWEPEWGFQRLKATPPFGVFPPKITLVAIDGYTHWRPLDEPAGDVTWEVEIRPTPQSKWVNSSRHPGRCAAEHQITSKRTEYPTLEYRLVKVTRKVVDEPEEDD